MCVTGGGSTYARVKRGVVNGPQVLQQVERVIARAVLRDVRLLAVVIARVRNVACVLVPAGRQLSR
jgi:hypothetical protein